MKRQICISILLAIIVIILAWILIKFTNARKLEIIEPDTQQTDAAIDSVPISQDYSSYKYYLKVEDGHIAVYDVKTDCFYMETGIETYQLPGEMLQRLENGIFFQTEAELFDFLEGYSS